MSSFFLIKLSTTSFSDLTLKKRSPISLKKSASLFTIIFSCRYFSKLCIGRKFIVKLVYNPFCLYSCSKSGFTSPSRTLNTFVPTPAKFDLQISSCIFNTFSQPPLGRILINLLLYKAFSSIIFSNIYLANTSSTKIRKSYPECW